MEVTDFEVAHLRVMLKSLKIRASDLGGRIAARKRRIEQLEGPYWRKSLGVAQAEKLASKLRDEVLEREYTLRTLLEAIAIIEGAG